MAQHMTEQPVESGHGHEIRTLDGRPQGRLTGVADAQVQLHRQRGVDPGGPGPAAATPPVPGRGVAGRART